MPRRLLVLAILVLSVLSLVSTPSVADGDEDPSPPDPRHRVDAWTPKPAGVRSEIVLQYGPYVVHPGSDLSRVDVEIAPLDGYVIAARPAVRLVDGTEPPDSTVHIHHAHWIVVDHETPGYQRWFFGTGEERTRGGGDEYMKADPRYYSEGLRYGVPVRRGDKLAFVSMLHNKSASPLTLWIEGRFTFVNGARADIKAATGEDFHELTPTLHGTTFQVPRVGGLYTWPRDATGGASGSIKPGIGHTWTAPFGGTIVIGAGHLHPGGKEVVVSNLGQPDSPCGASFGDDADGDGYAGVTIQRVQAYYKDGIFPSENFQMGITKLGWRAKIRKGDVLAINGTYDTTSYAYPDAMSFFGFFTDASEPPAAGEECRSYLVNDAGAPQSEVVSSIPNRSWSHAGAVCTVCDKPGPLPAKGQWTNQIHVGGFAYTPGDIATADLTGAPWVRKGETIRVVNEDWAAGAVRHSLTSCRAPCNGGYYANYPFHDGTFDTGALGATPVDTYATTQAAPTAAIDTSRLDVGYQAYYCRLHPWMRGGFYVEPSSA